MNGVERRDAIFLALERSVEPLSAGGLAGQFGVSRQIIVGDIALLRAAGASILSTPRGYLLDRRARGLLRTVVCRHEAEDMERELFLMVDQGCTVLDVAVEHPIYGQLSGQLSLSSRYDVTKFIQKVVSCETRPLSLLTEGVHRHTLSCPDEQAFERVRAVLAAEGFLMTEGDAALTASTEERVESARNLERSSE